MMLWMKQDKNGVVLSSKQAERGNKGYRTLLYSKSKSKMAEPNSIMPKKDVAEDFRTGRTDRLLLNKIQVERYTVCWVKNGRSSIVAPRLNQQKGGYRCRFTEDKEQA